MGPCCMMTMTFLRETTLGKWPDEEVMSLVWYCIHQLLTLLTWSHERLVNIKDDLRCGWDVTNRHHYSCKQQCQDKECILIRNWFNHNSGRYNIKLQPNQILSAWPHSLHQKFISFSQQSSVWEETRLGGWNFFLVYLPRVGIILTWLKDLQAGLDFQIKCKLLRLLVGNRPLLMHIGVNKTALINGSIPSKAAYL